MTFLDYVEIEQKVEFSYSPPLPRPLPQFLLLTSCINVELKESHLIYNSFH